MSSFSQSNYRSVEIVTGPALVPTIGWTALAVFLQTVFAQLVTIHGTVPSLVTIAVALYALKAGARRAVLLGIVAGVLEDCFAQSGGAWTIATTLTALGAGAIARGFFSDGFVMLSAVVALAVVVRDALFWAVMSLEGYPPGLAIMHLHTTLWQAGLSALCALGYLLFRARFINDRTAIERF